MKFPADIEIVTIQDDERYEVACTGEVTLDGQAAYIRFYNGEDELCVGISDDSVTLTNLSPETPYTMLLVPGRFGSVPTAGGNSLTMRTDRVRVRRQDHRLDLSAKYVLMPGRNEVATQIFLKCKYRATV